MYKLSFTLKEIKDILISILTLSLIFSYPEILITPSIFLISFLSVGLGFMGHELSHKFMARRLGFFSEYRMWTQGLILALILAFITNGMFVFAAPGAVVFGAYWFFTQPTKENIGKIGLSGPLFNITISLIFGFLNILYPYYLFRIISDINAWLAIFNLIPFPPLDGHKVFAWNPKVWVIVMVLGFFGMIV